MLILINAYKWKAFVNIKEVFMIEVLFGEAEAGAMKIAKEKGYVEGSIDGVIYEKENQ